MGTVTESESVTCDECGEFQMSKSFHGAAVGLEESEYDKVTLPSDCPVCGADL